MPCLYPFYPVKSSDEFNTFLTSKINVFRVNPSNQCPSVFRMRYASLVTAIFPVQSPNHLERSEIPTRRDNHSKFKIHNS